MWLPSLAVYQNHFNFKSQYFHLSNEIVSTLEWELSEMIHVKHIAVRWHTGHPITTNNSSEDMRMSAPVCFHYDLHVITTLCKLVFFHYPIHQCPTNE